MSLPTEDKEISKREDVLEATKEEDKEEQVFHSTKEEEFGETDSSVDVSEREARLEKTDNFLNKIGLKFNAEIRGVERVPESKREDGNWLNSLTVFLSPNFAVSTLSTGMMGPTYYDLDFRTCILCIVFMGILGSIPVGLYSIFGAKFGLRQQILSRYFTGNIMGRVFAFFNVISCIGWNAINIIPSVQMLVSLGSLPAWAGCLIFVVITSVLALFGYKTIHIYERYCWIPNCIVYLIIIARFTMSHKFTWGHMETGTTEAGNVLTFISAIFGLTAGWSPSAADYFVYMPSNTNPWKIFFCMVVGLSFPAIFTMILGAAIATSTHSDPAWKAAYDDNSVGGLIYQVLVTDSLHGFGKFCVVVLAFSTISNNLPGSYSLSLATQAIWSPLARFPRLGWCLIGNFVSLALCIPAYYVFAETMSNFLSIIGYNVSIYIGITLAEHFVFRRGFKGYNPEDCDDRSKLPVGVAGVFAFAVGVACTVLSMNQTWYQGVIAKKLGEYGGDIGFELNIAGSFIAYCCARPFELKYFGR